jgi:hypothetical protein
MSAKSDAGSATIEYVIVLLAAAALAALLYTLLTGETVTSLVTALVTRALSVAS